MDRTVLISLPVEDLQSLIMDCVNSCLKHYPFSPAKAPESQDDILTVEQLAVFLDLTVPTIYSKTCKGELPSMKRGKRLYFSREKITDYLKQGGRETYAQIEASPEDFLKGQRKKRA